MCIHDHGTDLRRNPGFTVLELMLTVSIACILLLTGIPSFQQFSRLQNMKAAVGSLQNDLMMGRSEAVTINTHVVACPGEPGPGCSGGTNWARGWIVFADLNADRKLQTDERIIRRGHAVDNIDILGSQGRTEIRFFPNGSAPGSNGSITFCGMGGPAEARKLVISNLGRIRRDTASNTDPANCPT
jgi:type IV fimbrial biogenesis protein FimT